MGDFKVAVPAGYKVVETDNVDETEHVYAHLIESTAKRHAEQLNEERLGPVIRWVAERSSKELRQRYGWGHRWCVVPYQNVLRKIEK